MEVIKKEIDSASSEQLNAFHKCISGLVEPVSEKDVYHYTTIDALFNGVLQSGKEGISEVIHPYLNLVSALKHKAYLDEDEVRLVLVAGEADRKFRFKDNKFIPYVEQYFPKEVLTEIIVGPNNDMPRTVYSLETYLKHLGFDHVKVTASDIPYKD